MLDLNEAAIILSLCLSILSLLIFFCSSHPGPSSKTPCPESYPILGNLIGLLRNYHRFHDWVADLLSQTPSLTLQVNTFLNTSHGICTANPLNINHLLVSNFPNYIKGSRFNGVLHELLGDGIFNVDGHLWTVQRKISSHEFNTTSLKHFIADIVQSELSTRLIPILSSACENNRVIDLQDILQKFTFDNICNLAFGVDPACLSSETAVDNSLNSSFVQAFNDAVDICSSRFLAPVQALWKIKRFLNIGSEKRLKEAINIVNDYAAMIIKSKEDQSSSGDCKNLDLLSRFMSSSSNSGLGLEFDDQEQKRKLLRDIVISFILAGKESTSTALTWFFWLIAGHPRCEALILAELIQAAPAPEKSLVVFSYADLKELNYLHAALSESLRLFPPVPIDSRLTVADDTLPDGTPVRKGWFADYSAYAVGRMDQVWGPDCREYRPERWLDEGGRFRPSDPFRFPVFHGGPRVCLGRDMAYVQMKSIAASVMHEFELSAVDGGGCAGKMEDPPYTLSLLLKMKGGLRVRIRRRPHHSTTST